MTSLLLLIGAVAVGCGGAPAPTVAPTPPPPEPEAPPAPPPPPPQATGEACGRAAETFRAVPFNLAAEEGAGELPETLTGEQLASAMFDATVEACPRDAWSDASVACFVAAQAPDAIGGCIATLTEEQNRGFLISAMREISKRTDGASPPSP